jgi:hypothetical protein
MCSTLNIVLEALGFKAGFSFLNHHKLERGFLYSSDCLQGMGFSLEVSVDEPDRAKVLLLKETGYENTGKRSCRIAVKSLLTKRRNVGAGSGIGAS